MKKILIILFLSSNLYAGVVADTIYLEARGEGEKGMRAVASVIYNRAKGKPENYEKVCLKPKQFSCWNLGKYTVSPKKSKDIKAYEICKKIEEEMENGKFKPMGKWTHYFNPNLCFPKWAKGAELTHIGNHAFF